MNEKIARLKKQADPCATNQMIANCKKSLINAAKIVGWGLESILSGVKTP